MTLIFSPDPDDRLVWTVTSSTTVAELRRKAGAGDGDDDKKLILIMDRRLPPSEQCSDRRERRLARCMYDEEEREAMAAQVEARAEEICTAMATDLAAELGDHILATLELSCGGGVAASAYVKDFRTRTHEMWLAGDLSTERGILRIPGRLAALESQWRGGGRGAMEGGGGGQRGAAAGGGSKGQGGKRRRGGRGGGGGGGGGTTPPRAQPPEAAMPPAPPAASATPKRDMLTAVLTAQVVDLDEWTTVADKKEHLFSDPAELRLYLLQRKKELTMPQTIKELAASAGVKLKAKRPAMPRLRATGITRAQHLAKKGGALDYVAKHAHPSPMTATAKAAVLKRLVDLQGKRLGRRRFQPYLLATLLACESATKTGKLVRGALLNLAKMDEEKAAAILAVTDTATFCAQLRAAVGGVGKLWAIKAASLLQFTGSLTGDTVPDLGDDESPCCYMRAMAHNVLAGKMDEPTWLKQDVMDELGYPKLSAAQTKALLAGTAGKAWAVAAEAWWGRAKEEHKELGERWDGAMHKLLLRARTKLQVESAMCEQGSRQKAAKAGKSNKGKWEPGPCKDMSSVVVLHGAAGELVGRETGVDLRSARRGV